MAQDFVLGGMCSIGLRCLGHGEKRKEKKAKFSLPLFGLREKKEKMSKSRSKSTVKLFFCFFSTFSFLITFLYVPSLCINSKQNR